MLPSWPGSADILKSSKGKCSCAQVTLQAFGVQQRML